ncbi:MAG: hypothetical protein ACRESJ_05410 [Pseudomonas sp.]|uniref:hypothetical protein n=1 Tax=Pseudomonas sp. TaxID=306 RepID=UPI003D7022DF
MHRIDGPGATVDNKFTDGDPVGGVAATVVTDDWMNDVQENIMAVLSAAGVTPTKGRAADLLDSLKGRLIGVQVFTANGTYTPSTGTKSIIAELVGGGGGSGGVAATAAGQNALSTGGGYGAYAKGRFITGFNGASIIVGTAGTAGAAGANPGGNGGASSIGVLISAPGGLGGVAGPATANTGPFVTLGSGLSPTPSGANIAGYQGQSSSFAISISSSTAPTSNGGSGPLGSGGPAPTTPGAKSGSGYGSGASGNYNFASKAADVGGAGQPGIVIIYEYA